MFDNNTASSSAAGVVGAGAASDHAFSNKRKRRPAGTPDPDAEVVSLSPKTLLESDRYVCEICNQGFQRDQNLQMHRRRHKVPWKLLKRETVAAGTDAAAAIKKRVFVCPEPSCLHHDPCHALGDLVGIKKHFRRKHSSYKQWVCQRCSKGYAVQSDYKAHLKTCGTRGHSCDCGRVFSRVESFIEHQDACTSRMVVRPDHHHHLLASSAAACSSGTASSTSPSSDAANFSTIVPFPHHPPPKLTTLSKPSAECMANNINNKSGPSNLELQLLLPPPSSPPTNTSLLFPPDKNNRVTAAAATHLKLSIGSSSSCHMDDYNETKTTEMQARRLKEVASEEMKLAVAEKAFAEEARQEAKRQIEMAEMEFVNAKRIRQQAQAELEKARILKDEAVKKVSCTILQITCHSCKQQFQVQPHPQQQQLLLPPPSDEMSFAVSYMSSATEGEGER